MVYNEKYATDQAQRRGVKWSAGPYTGLFYPHRRAKELRMRVDSVLNIDAPQFALHSPGPHTRDDPSRHGQSVCTACALRAHCSETHPMPPLYNTAKQQSQQDTH